jgi:hypothetical protein
MAVLVAATVLLVHFWPILTAAPLGYEHAFEHWMWLESWR